MPTAVNAPAAGVLAPASKLTTDRAKPPVTGKPPLIPAAMFDVPSPISKPCAAANYQMLCEIAASPNPATRAIAAAISWTPARMKPVAAMPNPMPWR